MTDHPSALVSVPVEAVNTLKRHIPSLDAAATPTKSEVFVVCGHEAREMHDAIAMLAAAPAAPQDAGVGGLTNEQIQSVMLAALKEVRAAVTDHVEAACMDADIARMERGPVDMGETGWEVMRAVHRRLSALRAPSREPEGGASLLEAADKAHRACMSAWACGEPYHRVKTMMDAVERLGDVVAQCKDTAPATREEAPQEAGVPSLVDWFSQFIERHQEGCGSDTDALIACLDRVRDSYRAQPQAREDAQPVDDKPLTKAQRSQLFHILRSGSVEVSGSWSVFDALATRGLIYISEYRIGFYRARATEKALAAYGSELGINALATTHPAPDALRVAVEAYLTAVDDLETPVMSPSLGLHRKEVASQARGKLKEALTALQAEQGAK